MKLSTNLWWN